MDILNELKERGLVYQISNEEGVRKVFNTKGTSFYFGFDPTAESLHVGSLLQISTAKRLERNGLKPIALVGGATGLIGDPSFKEKERTLKSKEEINSLAESLKKQLGTFFNFNKDAVFLNNLDWMEKISYIDFARDVGKKFTVNEMIAKEAVKERMKTGISFTEFSYMLLQAYDFLRIFEKYDCRLEMGGSDQWGNITAGIELVRKAKGEEVFGLTLPLVTRSDGKKFSKSEGTAVWLDPNLTSPYHFYQFWINAADSDAVKLLKYYTFLTLDEIKNIEDAFKKSPEKREAQRILAREVTTFVHGKDAFKNAENISENLFAGKIKDLSEQDLRQIFTDSSALKLAPFGEEGVNIVELLINSKVADSKRQAREDIQNKAIELNGEKMGDLNYIVGNNNLLFGKYLIIKRGKKDYRFILVG